MKKVKIVALFALMACFFTNSFSQDRPIRIGLKFGWPQIAGLNLEYVTPLVNKRLAADVDLSYFSFGSGNDGAGYLYYSLGGNYYFMNEGKGLYGGLGFSGQNFNAEWTDSGLGAAAGTGVYNYSASASNYSTYIKLGGKHGGLFYFRWELGYRIAVSEGKLEASATANGVIQKDSYDMPVGAGGIITNVGFGFSF